ncbi:MAG: hypothetical protein KAR40_09515 [Candidatus Sabulitectum sp.]|nr:hypothetical protein [Candidatus Sabulitectum sp.]
MKKKDVELLKGSIGKWLKIRRSVKALDRGVDNCSLCIGYSEPVCDGCPVKEHTGSYDCRQTPYVEWVKHQEGQHNLEIEDPFHRFHGCKECTRIASDMLGFLVGLLPVKEIKKILD